MIIEEQPLEYQVVYWKRRAEMVEAKLDREQRRKAPETLKEAEEEVRRLQDTERMLRKDVEVWKRVAGDMSNRVTILEDEGGGAVLRRERDFWRDRWRNCTKRLGNCIEHLGLDHTGTEPNPEEP